MRLRASFRLAPSSAVFSRRSKAHDAFDRRLPPIRLRTPAPRLFPAPHPTRHRVGSPAEFGLRGVENRRPARFTTRNRPLRQIVEKDGSGCSSSRNASPRPSLWHPCRLSLFPRRAPSRCAACGGSRRDRPWPRARERARPVTVRDAFRRQEPFLDPVARVERSPVPDHPTRATSFRSPRARVTVGWRSHATLGFGSGPRSFHRPSPPNACSSLREGHRTMGFHPPGRVRPLARSPFTRADHPFWGSLRERIRDQTAPDDFCNIQRCAGTDRSSRILAGTGTAIPFRFSRATKLPRGLWHAASARVVRAARPRCWFLPLARVFPTAIPNRPRHLDSACASTSKWRLTSTGPRTERRTCPLRPPFRERAGRVCLVCARRRRSPPRRSRDTLSSSVRRCSRGGDPERAADRPRPPFRNRPAKDGAFQEIRVPSTVDSGELADRSAESTPASRPRRPTLMKGHPGIAGALCG